MALPPSIPTSFVPHTVASARQRFHPDFIGAFNFLSYFILLVVVSAAVGVFFYSRILLAQQQVKDKELSDAQSSIDSATAEGFIRLHDRLVQSQTLLNNHTAFSEYFGALEALLPTTVRFSSMQVSYGDSKSVVIKGSGTAKSFNALAFASKSFASNGQIRDAIFSSITVNKDSSVGFSLSAEVDPQLVTFRVPEAVATSTDATIPAP